MDNKSKTEQPDGLFRKKLKDHEESVNPEIWGRITKEKGDSPKPVWSTTRFWGAAVLGGLLLAGGIWVSLRPEYTREQISLTEASSNRASLAETDHSGPDESQAVETIGQNEQSPDTEVNLAVPSFRASIEPSSNLKEKAVEPDQTIAGRGEVAFVEPRLETATIGQYETLPGTTDSNHVKEEEDMGRVETRVLVVYVTPPVEPIQEAVTEEVEVVQNAVVSTEPERKERKGIHRFFRQLKNAKTGEKIDWEELGINPQRVFANVNHSQE